LLALSPGMEKAALYRSFSERLKLLKERTQVNGIYLASTERTNIVSSDPALRIGQPLPRLDLLAAELEIARRGEASASRLVRVNDTQYKSAIAPIYAADRVVAFLMIDMSPWYLEYLNTFKNSLLIFTAIALFCCALSARWFSKTITTPISQMVQRVEEIGKAQYEQPLEMKGKDEIATLAKSIEIMRQNILHRDVQMRMMLSGIAHEIRNPLGGMELFAGILDNEKLTEHQRVYVAKITAEIQNLKRLLNDFLEFAKPKKLELEEISVPDLIGEIQSMFGQDLDQRNGRWSVHLQPDVRMIMADRFKLKQALINVYRNAFQALPQSGEIVSRMQKNGAGIVMEISNTLDCSLESEVLEHLFEPFFTTKEKGIGLGLPLARRIIEAHGGKLELVENRNNRITFAVKLPGAGEIS
ncbi:MAG TPA: HAMP domain-containing sensor histidine kinase, partial [Acidobacteriota bacterium]|nr:HAMP domain-containing sensor histidine kinase [Acidobacteriota bacterium]